MAFLNKAGIERLWVHIISKLGEKVDMVEGKGLSTNDYTTAEKNKLAGISESADAVSFSRSLTSGTKVGTITINGTGTDLYAPTNTTYSDATTSAAGLMSAADKAKLDGIESGANNTIVDSTLSVEGQAADAKATGDTFSRLKGEVAAKADKTALAHTDRSLDALWKLNQGVTYQFETDNDGAYQKQVISGAKLADIQSVGGKTVVWNQLIDIHNAQGYPNTHTNTGVYFTPNEDGTIKITGGYTGLGGSAWYNLYNGNLLSSGRKILVCGHGVDTNIRIYDGITYFSTMDKNIITLGSSIVNIYVGISVSEIDTVCKPQIFDLTQLFGAGNEPTSTDDSRIAWIKQYAAAHPEYNAGELVSADVESVKYNDSVIADILASVRELPGYGWSAGTVCNSIEHTDSGWRYVQRVGSRSYQDSDTITDGAITYYALPEPIVTDITDLMDGALDAITVEAGGTLTFENAAKMPVPSSVEYAVKISEVGA